MIAADWHGGQWSALYALSSSGAISRDAWREASHTLRDVNEDHPYVPLEAVQEISSLIDFLGDAESRWNRENPDAEDFPEYLYGPGKWED